MKILMLFLLIPLSTQAGDMCVDLANYYKGFEKDLASKTLPKCGEFKLTDKADDFLKGFANDDDVYNDDAVSNKSEPLIDRVKCKDVSFLENRMRDLENKLNSINGFNKLVKTISDDQNKISLEKVKEKAALDGFITNVRTAALLETFVQNEDIFKLVTAADLVDKNTYAQGMTDHCNKLAKDNTWNKTRIELCESLNRGEVSKSTLFTLRALQDTYSKVQDDAGKTNLLKSWKDEMAISKKVGDDNLKGEQYSFAELNNEIKNKPTATVTQMLKTIKETPKIIHNIGTNKDLKELFQKIDVYQAERAKTNEVKRLVTVHEELLERQKDEAKSRLSLIWMEFKPEGSVETDPTKFVAILETVLNDSNSTINASQKTHLREALQALKATTEQVSHFENVTKCLDVEKIEKASFTNSEKAKNLCDATMSLASAEQQDLISELSILKKVHKEIVDVPANAKLIQMKQLAVDALARNNCTTSSSSDISDCSISGVLNPVMKNIMIDALKVSLMYVEPTEDELSKANEICFGADKSTYNAFCALAAKVEEKKNRPDRSNETYTGPMDPESRNSPSRQALYNGIRNLASQMGQIFQQNKMPYYLNNGPGSYGAASPTISGYLIGGSVASGQLRSYSSVTQNMQNMFVYQPIRR